MPVTAYSYIRFSSEPQAQGDSLRRQLELSDAYVKQHGLHLDTTLNLKDLGVSAFRKTNAETGALADFLEEIKNGKVKKGSMLLVESLDRISRAEVMEALAIFTQIINAGISIVTLADNQVFSKESIKQNWAQLIITISIMARAHEESMMKSQRIKAAWTGKKQNYDEKKPKIAGKYPLWLELSADKKKFKLKPDATKVVKKIYKMSLNGMGVYTICQRLNEEGVANISGKRPWSNGYVQKILSATAIYGEANFKDADPIPNYYPAIMSKDEWLRQKAIRSARLHGGGGKKLGVLNNLFSGILHCGYCGSTMRVSGYTEPANKTNPKQHYKYIVCAGSRDKYNCTSVQWKLAEFESAILTYLTELDVGSILTESFQNVNKTLKNLTEQRETKQGLLIDNQKRIENLIDALAEAQGAPPKAVMEAITKLEAASLGLNRDIQTLSDKISNIAASTDHLEAQQASLAQLTSVLGSEERYRIIRYPNPGVRRY